MYIYIYIYIYIYSAQRGGGFSVPGLWTICTCMYQFHSKTRYVLCIVLYNHIPYSIAHTTHLCHTGFVKRS